MKNLFIFIAMFFIAMATVKAQEIKYDPDKFEFSTTVEVENPIVLENFLTNIEEYYILDEKPVIKKESSAIASDSFKFSMRITGGETLVKCKIIYEFIDEKTYKITFKEITPEAWPVTKMVSSQKKRLRKKTEKLMHGLSLYVTQNFLS